MRKHILIPTTNNIIPIEIFNSKIRLVFKKIIVAVLSNNPIQNIWGNDKLNAIFSSYLRFWGIS